MWNRISNRISDFKVERTDIMHMCERKVNNIYWDVNVEIKVNSKEYKTVKLGSREL